LAEFTGKSALITGAGNGIGRAAAVLFAKRGACVTVADLNQAAGRETVALIEAAGGKAIFIDGDVANEDCVRDMVARTVAAYGRLDCAFNNAGISHPRDPQWDPESFERTMAVNVTGVMHCLRHEIRQMRLQGGGAIVNTSSVGGMIASTTPSMPAYTASKHAVIGLTKSAALTCAREGIRVNAIMPGVTQTDMVRGVMAQGPEVRQALENFAPMGRMAQPEEIAEAALWLCSERASFVTGHALAVDGGFLAQ
jgi:NAD(P)-dependent dehydrogenase (short-subunit alcohol dehydrogenase family)